ncbi:hypothetical protein X975_16636, partial [Stegodyphus mimosarum]
EEYNDRCRSGNRFICCHSLLANLLNVIVCREIASSEFFVDKALPLQLDFCKKNLLFVLILLRGKT